MNGLTEQDRLAVMAHVDGELPPAQQAAFEARLAQEPALASAVSREQALRARLQSAFAPVLDEPVPAALRGLLATADAATAANDPIRAGGNDAHRATLPHARRWQWREWGAMAASLVLGVVFGARLLAPHASAGDPPGLALNVGSDAAITARGPLRDALENRLAGAGPAPDAPVAVGLSFRNHARQFCRTFTLDGASSGIACKQRDDWVVAHLEQAPAAPASAAGAYRTAASPFSATLLQAVDAMRDGDTLDGAAEASARARRWLP